MTQPFGRPTSAPADAGIPDFDDWMQEAADATAQGITGLPSATGRIVDFNRFMEYMGVAKRAHREAQIGDENRFLEESIRLFGQEPLPLPEGLTAEQTSFYRQKQLTEVDPELRASRKGQFSYLMSAPTRPMIPESFVEHTPGPLKWLSRGIREASSPLELGLTFGIASLGPGMARGLWEAGTSAATSANLPGALPMVARIGARALEPLVRGGLPRRLAAETLVNVGAATAAGETARALPEEWPGWAKALLTTTAGFGGGGATVAGLDMAPRAAAAGGRSLETAVRAVPTDVRRQVRDVVLLPALMVLGDGGDFARRTARELIERPQTRPAAMGTETFALQTGGRGRQPYQMKVVELDDVLPSHDPHTFEPQADYPPDMQPRGRDRQSMVDQVRRIATEFDPDELLTDFHRVDTGPPIVGADNIVESGNGRVMALQLARGQEPARYDAYKAALRERAGEFGITATQLEQFENPVLVRERTFDVDRSQFAEDANIGAAASFSTAEQAAVDSRRIDAVLLRRLQPGTNATIEEGLRSAGNRDFVAGFMENIPPTQRAALVDASGDLSQAGINRISAAVFAHTYGEDAGARLLAQFYESADEEMLNVYRGLRVSLARTAQAESLIRAGERETGLSIASDVATAVNKMLALRQQGMPVDMYLRQLGMLGPELTPFQLELLQALEGRVRSATRMGRLLDGYAQGVIDSTPPTQQALMEGAPRPDHDRLWRQALEAAPRVGEQAAAAPEQAGMFAAGQVPEERIGFGGEPIEAPPGPAGPPEGIPVDMATGEGIPTGEIRAEGVPMAAVAGEPLEESSLRQFFEDARVHDADIDAAIARVHQVGYDDESLRLVAREARAAIRDIENALAALRERWPPVGRLVGAELEETADQFRVHRREERARLADEGGVPTGRYRRPDAGLEPHYRPQQLVGMSAERQFYEGLGLERDLELGRDHLYGHPNPVAEAIVQATRDIPGIPDELAVLKNAEILRRLGEGFGEYQGSSGPGSVTTLQQGGANPRLTVSKDDRLLFRGAKLAELVKRAWSEHQEPAAAVSQRALPERAPAAGDEGIPTSDRQRVYPPTTSEPARLPPREPMEPVPPAGAVPRQAGWRGMRPEGAEGLAVEQVPPYPREGLPTAAELDAGPLARQEPMPEFAPRPEHFGGQVQMEPGPLSQQGGFRDLAEGAEAGFRPPPRGSLPTGRPPGEPPREIFLDVQDFAAAIEVRLEADAARRLALMTQNVPILNRAVRAGDPSVFLGNSGKMGRAVIGHMELRFQGGQKVVGGSALLDSIGRETDVFGSVDADGVITSGNLKGFTTHEVAEQPRKFNLTSQQQEYLAALDRLNREKLGLFKRYGITVAPLHMPEGGHWVGRRWVAKYDKAGELVDLATISDRPPPPPGIRSAQEKHRRYRTAAEAREDGFVGMGLRDAAIVNFVGAYNRVVDKQFSDWVIANVPHKTGVGTVFERELYTGIPALAGRRFALADRALAREYFSQTSSSTLASINQFNAVQRLVALGLDVSPFGIQLILMPAFTGLRVPLSAADRELMRFTPRVMRDFFAAMVSPEYHARVRRDNMADFQAMTRVINTYQGTEWTEALHKSGWLTSGPLKPLGWAARPWQRGFEAALDLAGLYLWQGLVKARRGKLSAGELAQVEDFINKARGIVDTKRLGVSTRQRQWESVFLLAARYRRAVAALHMDVLRGSLRGQLAREAYLKTALGFVLIFMGLSYALTGKVEWDRLSPVRRDSNGDLKGNSRFLMWEAGKTLVGPGSKYVQDIRLLAKIVADPSSFAKLGEFEEFWDNPGVKWVRGQMAAAPSTFVDVMIGRDYMGEPVRGGDSFLEGSLRLLRRLGENIIPIWGQAVLEHRGSMGDLAVTAGAEVVGGRSYPRGRSDVLDEVSLEMPGIEKAYEDLNEVDYRRLWADMPAEQRIELDQIEMEGVRRGYLPARYRFELRRNEAERYGREQDLLRRFWAGELEREGQRKSAYNYRRWFLDEYYALQDEMRGARDNIRRNFELAGLDMEFEDEEPLDEKSKALGQYFDTFAQATNQAGNLDRTQWSRLVAALEAKWTPEQTDYVEEYRSLKQHPPGLVEVLDMKGKVTTARLRAIYAATSSAPLRQDLVDLWEREKPEELRAK